VSGLARPPSQHFLSTIIRVRTQMDLSLNEQLGRLREILSATRSRSFWQSLPIIDETKDGDVVDIQDNDLPGLRHLRMSIQKEIETIEAVSNGSVSLSMFSLIY
jgi:hypothetical protein